MLVDTLGNVRANWVVPASESDVATAMAFWNAVAARCPLLEQVELVLGDNSLAGRFADELRERYGIRFGKLAQVLVRKKNFCIRKLRWRVERTLAWLSNDRRLSKEYDRLLTQANAWLA